MTGACRNNMHVCISCICVPVRGTRQVDVALLVWSSIWLYARALENVMAGGGNQRHTREIVEATRGVKFEGTSGYVSIDERGDRQLDMTANTCMHACTQTQITTLFLPLPGTCMPWHSIPAAMAVNTHTHTHTHTHINNRTHDPNSNA